MKNDPIQSALAALDDIPLHTEEGRKQIAKALGAKSNLVVAKIARIVGEAQWRELTPDLAGAFERLRKRGAEADKGCAAMMAIARALFNLNYGGEELFLNGIRHVRREPGWEGSTDTAGPLRAICARGLVNTRNPEKLAALVDLLADSVWEARPGAVRALAANGSEAAMLLLRFKALSGDPEPEVLAGCFQGLLSEQGADAIRFVSSFTGSRAGEMRAAAVLALGASRRIDAIEWLKQRFGETADEETRKCILLALATSRTSPAIDFVVGLIRNGSSSESELAASAMKINRGDRSIQEKVEKALRAR